MDDVELEQIGRVRGPGNGVFALCSFASGFGLSGVFPQVGRGIHAGDTTSSFVRYVNFWYPNYAGLLAFKWKILRPRPSVCV